MSRTLRNMRTPVLALAAAAATVGGNAVAASAHATRAAITKTTVTVAAREFKFTLSRTTVHRGIVIFKVTNKGKIAHDFKINGKATKILSPGRSAVLTVTFTRPGSYAYLCTVPGHASAGMKGKLKVT
jgi:uncharacterized cupredoxin-like copper-binding protein